MGWSRATANIFLENNAKFRAEIIKSTSLLYKFLVLHVYYYYFCPLLPSVKNLLLKTDSGWTHVVYTHHPNVWNWPLSFSVLKHLSSFISHLTGNIFLVVLIRK